MSDNQNTNVVPGGVIDMAKSDKEAMDTVANIAGQPAVQQPATAPNLKAVTDATQIPVEAKPKALSEVIGEKNLSEFLARQCEANGFTEEARKLRNREPRGAFMKKVDQIREHRITVGDVVTVAALGTAIWLAYEGVVYYFEMDAPRALSTRPVLPKGKK